MFSVRRLLTLLAASTLFVDCVRTATTITCAAGTAYVGETSNITCHFNSDVKGNRNSINVAMTSPTADGNKEERDVLQCSWMQNADKPDCLVTDGYTFNYDITDRLTVEIPSTKAAFAGTYSCHIVPPNGATTKSCELVVKEKPATFSTRIVESIILGSPAEHTDSQQGILTSILVLLILLIILVISVALYHAWKMKWLPSSIPFRTTHNTNVEENAAIEPLNPTHETATADANTQTERASLQDVGTECPTDIPLAAAPQEKPVSIHVLMSGESGLEFQPVSTEDKPTKKKHSGKFVFGSSRRSKEKKSKEEEQK